MQNDISITSNTFHEKLPADDPAGSKHVADVHNKQITQ
jgi:hypothetical protein